MSLIGVRLSKVRGLWVGFGGRVQSWSGEHGPMERKEVEVMGARCVRNSPVSLEGSGGS